MGGPFQRTARTSAPRWHRVTGPHPPNSPTAASRDAGPRICPDFSQLSPGPRCGYGLFETTPGMGILPAQVRPPHAARDDVVPGGVAQTDQTGTRLRHLPASFSVRFHANADAESLRPRPGDGQQCGCLIVCDGQQCGCLIVCDLAAATVNEVGVSYCAVTSTKWVSHSVHPEYNQTAKKSLTIE
jgi:hypothetical protein